MCIKQDQILCVDEKNTHLFVFLGPSAEGWRGRRERVTRERERESWLWYLEVASLKCGVWCKHALIYQGVKMLLHHHQNQPIKVWHSKLLTLWSLNFHKLLPCSLQVCQTKLVVSNLIVLTLKTITYYLFGHPTNK